MGSRERKRAARGGGEPAPPVVDTWIKLGNEIIRLVLPHRSHTVNLILLLTVPTSVIAGVVVTASLVLVPHPPLAVGVLASSVVVYGLVRVRIRRLPPPTPTALGHSDAGAEDPTSLPPP